MTSIATDNNNNIVNGNNNNNNPPSPTNLTVKRDSNGSNDDNDDDTNIKPISMWEKEEKYFFILSDAGKPIFASTGEDTQDIIPLMGVASLIIARSNNNVRTVVAGDTTIVFLLREPLYLFIAAKTGETVAHLRRQLKYLYAQITFFLTTRPFNAMAKIHHMI